MRTTKCIFRSRPPLYFPWGSHPLTRPASQGKSMKKLAVAAAATALLSAGPAAEQTARPAAAKPATTAPKMATSHASNGASLSVESQNQLVGQYCATCHSERGKA